MSQLTRDWRTDLQRTQNELRLLKLRSSSGQQAVLPSTQVADIDHLFETFSEFGAPAPGITIDGSHFIVTIEVWTAGTMAAGTETYTITNKGSNLYRIVYTPLHPGSVYRTIVKVKPNGSTFGQCVPEQFQETPLFTF